MTTARTLLVLLLICGPTLAWAQTRKAPPPTAPPPVSSPFAQATSPFLRRAASQPVQWRPWGPDSFREARMTGKPIFLSVGASWCHWCLEMGRECFSDPSVAALLNGDFIPVVVDRDLRPDIDRRYQRVVLTLTGRGGWPLTAILTPDGDVIVGGGYYAAEDIEGRPGLLTILTRVTERWATDRAALEQAARRTTDRALRAEELLAGQRRPSFVPAAPTPSPAPGTTPAAPPPLPDAPPPSAKSIDTLVGAALETWDPDHGGFGQAPRFPHAMTLDLLIHYAEATGQSAPLDRALRGLDVLAEGAVRDPLTGLFFRYAVDEGWQHPGFEVLLTTNVELLQAYLHAYQVTHRAKYREVAEGIVRGMLSELSLAGGGFAASLSGEGPLGEEGGYYTWTEAELKAILTADELKVARARLGLEGTSVLPSRPGAGVPLTARTLPEVARIVGLPTATVSTLLSSALAKMHDARDSRPQGRDDTFIVSWNARAASVLFETWRVLGDEDALMAARASVERILGSVDAERTAIPHVLPASPWAGMDLAATRVTTVLAFTDAFEATGDPVWLAQAQRIMEGTLETFWDAEEGGFFDIPDAKRRQPLFSARWKEIADGVLPSTNALAAEALSALAQWTGDARYATLARQTLHTFEPVADQLGVLGASWAQAALAQRDPGPVVVIAGFGGADAAALTDVARRTFRPGKRVVTLSPADLDALTAWTLPGVGPMRDRTSPLAIAWLCSPAGCSKPISDANALAQAIRVHGRVSAPPGLLEDPLHTALP